MITSSTLNSLLAIFTENKENGGGLIVFRMESTNLALEKAKHFFIGKIIYAFSYTRFNRNGMRMNGSMLAQERKRDYKTCCDNFEFIAFAYEHLFSDTGLLTVIRDDSIAQHNHQHASRRAAKPIIW